MALQGGGFRAQSVDAGFFAGMLAAVGRQSKTLPVTFDSTGLMKRFSMVSTNSGSSWFFGSLAYSEGFRTLLEKMAASPANSAALYRAGYTSKWLLATQVDERRFNLRGLAARAIAKLLFGTGDEDSICSDCRDKTLAQLAVALVIYPLQPPPLTTTRTLMPSARSSHC